MRTNIFIKAKGLVKVLPFYLLTLLPFFTACSPEKFDGPSQSGLPSVSGVTINKTIDQNVNQATFSVGNMPQGTYPIWKINGTVYSTLSTVSWSNAKAGTYDIELRLGNKNGFSQSSINETFTFDKTQIDFTAYINRISRTWRINYAVAGHMGCGEPGTDGSNWWSAAPNDKADWGVYDDRITFDAGGNYSYNPGEGGTVYVNTGCSVFAEYNTNDGNDFMASVEPQASSYSFDAEGDNIVLVLAPNTLFPYISADDQLANPKFRVAKLTNNDMELLYDGNGITWRFVLTSKEEGDEPQPEAKVDWDYSSSANLWKAVDDGTALTGMGYYFADNNWSPIDYTEATHNGDTYEITMPAGLGGSQWQGQFHIDTNLKASASKKYNFYMVMEADNDCPGVTFKLTDAGDTNFFVEERIPVPAGQFVFKREGVSLKEGIDADAIRLFFDFGGTPGGTKVKISKIYLEEAVVMDYDDADNLWKAVDDGSALEGMGYYFADNNWSPIDYAEATHSGNAYELTLPEGLGGSQWQGQFHIDTKLTASASKTYNFQFVMEADQDCPGVTIKLTDAGDTNFFCEGRHDIPGGEPFVFKLNGATLKEGTDASAIRLFFDFGGSPAGTKVKISKIIFKEN
jgi:hypothetical protein